MEVLRLFSIIFILIPPISSDSSFESIFNEKPSFDEYDIPQMGSLFTNLFADSKQQLIVDLDLFRSIINAHIEYGKAIEEGNVELVKYGMQLVEKMREFDISPACISDMFHLTWSAVEYATYIQETKNCTTCQCTPYIHQKKNERQWIFNVLDAWGKMPAGITGGNNLWVGSWNTCRKISVVKNRQGQYWKGQYCLAHLNPYNRDNPLKNIGPSGPPDERCYSNPNTTVPPTEESPHDSACFDMIPLLNFGLCMPDTCTAYDVRKMVQFAYRGVETVVGRQFVCNVSIECRNEREEGEISKSPLSMAALLFLTFLIIMTVFGTLYDYVVVPSLDKPLKGDNYKSQPFFIKALLAFSAYSNGRKVLSTEDRGDQIGALFGMRFLSMAWIILGHTYYYLARSLTTDNLIPTLVNFPKMFYTQVIVQAPLAVDSFFFLSGLLSTYILFKKIIKDKKLKSNMVARPSLWILYYIRRYLRLTPMYIFVMWMNVTLFTFISNGPFWRPIEPEGCRHTWWVNLLYLNNFLLQDIECCMGWTWYLANDFQFHVILTPLLIIALNKNKKFGLSLSGALIFISTLIKLYIMEINEYPPAPILTAKLTIVYKIDSYWSDVYVKPYIRCAPFICGVVLGYLLVDLTKDRKDLSYPLSRRTNIIGWTVSTILGLYSVFGLYEYSRTGDISDWWRILYVIGGRNAFSLAISWVTFACTTGNGGIVNSILAWKFFTPLGKVTFGAYLIHPILLQIYNLSRPQPFHFTTFAQMFRHSFEALIISYLSAFIVHLLVEAPWQIFEGLIMDDLMNPKKKSNNNKEPIEESPLEDNFNEKSRMLKKEQNGHDH